MHKRRAYLARAGSLLSVTIAGCIQYTTGSNELQEKYTRDVICPEPPDEVPTVEYERPPPGSPKPEFLDDGYWDGTSDKIEDNRLGLITAEEHEELDFSTSNNDVDTDNRGFYEETDFQTSTLITFEYTVIERQEFAIEAVKRAEGEPIHVYACRFGDPNPDIDSEDMVADRAVARGTAVIRVNETPSRANFTYGWLPLAEDTPEYKTYTAESE